MNLEHRLQHAARELREITIDVPPLGRPVRRHRVSLIPALATPLLFAAGALFAVGAVRGVERPMQSDISVTTDLVVDPVGSPVANPVGEPVVEFDPALIDPIFAVSGAGVDVEVSAPTIHEELQMISAFLAESQASRAADSGDQATEPSDTVGIGPI